MKNWLKNLLFVLFSFVFLGVGMLIANVLIHQKGNPLKDPNFLSDISVDSASTMDSSSANSTGDWLKDTVQVSRPIIKAPKIESKETLPKGSILKDSPKIENYDVIVGMFGNRSNANKQIRKLKDLGFDYAYIYPKASMNVVSAGKFGKGEAEKIASNLNIKGFDTIVRRSIL